MGQKAGTGMKQHGLFYRWVLSKYLTQSAALNKVVLGAVGLQINLMESLLERKPHLSNRASDVEFAGGPVNTGP